MTLTSSTLAATDLPGPSSSPNTMMEPLLGPVYFGHVSFDEGSLGFRVLFAASESQKAAW